jgi:hypothetical protein
MYVCMFVCMYVCMYVCMNAVLCMYACSLAGDLLGLDAVSDLILGQYHTCVRMSSNNGLRCWGYNNYGV